MAHVWLLTDVSGYSTADVRRAAIAKTTKEDFILTEHRVSCGSSQTDDLAAYVVEDSDRGKSPT